LEQYNQFDGLSAFSRNQSRIDSIMRVQRNNQTVLHEETATSNSIVRAQSFGGYLNFHHLMELIRS